MSTTPTNNTNTNTTRQVFESTSNVGRQESVSVETGGEHSVRDSPHASPSVGGTLTEGVARERMAEIVIINNELSRLKKRVLAVNRSCVKNIETEVAAARLMNNMFGRRAARLMEMKAQLIDSGRDRSDHNVEQTQGTTTAATSSSSRVSLKDVYESLARCTVCMADHAGKDMVYMDNCTHVFCRLCVTRSRPQNRCMECRVKVSAFYAIVNEGERYRLKRYLINYDFILDRPLNRELNRIYRQGITITRTSSTSGGPNRSQRSSVQTPSASTTVTLQPLFSLDIDSPMLDLTDSD